MANTYTTQFPLTESTLSEGGNWMDGGVVGLDWKDVSTTPGFAHGTEDGTINFNDSTALLTGTWGPTQTVSAVVHVGVRAGGGTFKEVELRVRSSLSAHLCTGYEINFSMDSDSSVYTQIVRWNGALGDFTELDGRGGSQYQINDGDEVKAVASGNTITSYIRGIQVMQVTDSTFPTGSPGIGFYLQGTGVNDHGFTSFTATDGIDSPVIGSQPQSMAALVGSNPSFTVSASGAAPLFYQWYFNATNLIAGATNSVMAFTNVQPSQAGGYDVVVTNPLGTNVSAVVQLSVLSPPTLALTWSNGVPGSIQLTGTGPANQNYTVQYTQDLGNPNWQSLGPMVSDAFGAFLYVDPLPIADASRFYRVVSQSTP